MEKTTPPKKELLTIDDVAQEAGVSRSTVSLVLRNSPLVAETTNEKVRQAIERIGYVYNRKAAIRARLSYLVGIVVPQLTNPFFAELAAGIDSVLNEAGWVSLIGNSEESIEKQDIIIQRMQEQMVDGVVICPAVASPPGFADKLNNSGLLVLQMLRHIEPHPRNYVGIDYIQGVELAVGHLHSLGHTNILFLGSEPRHSAAVDRHTGYQSAMSRRGLKQRYKNCQLTRSGGASAIAEIFAEPDPPTAVVCFNDVVAMGAMVGLDRIGKRTGKDVSVVGFDNISEAEFVQPGLTTIDTDAHQLGVEAARIVLESIRAGKSPTVNTAMPTRIVLRESTGPMRQ